MTEVLPSTPALPPTPNAKELDLGNLACFDADNVVEDGSNYEALMLNKAVENATMIMHKIFDLPREAPQAGINGIIVSLPKCSTPVPREKPLPKPKALTTWEKFAQTKGIQKRKKSRMVFDETQGEYRPAWGYKRADDESENWVLPAKAGEDLSVDPWTRKENEKKERVAKNKGQQLKNLQGSLRGTEGKNRIAGAVDLSSAVQAPSKKAALQKKQPTHVDVALANAQKSTASMGTFDTLRKHEKAPKTAPAPHKNDPEYDLGQEKKQAMSILDRIMGNGAKEVGPDEKAARVVHKEMMQQTVQKGDKKGRGKRKRPGADGIADAWVLDTSKPNNRKSSKKAQKKHGTYGGKHGQGKGNKKGSSQKHKRPKSHKK